MPRGVRGKPFQKGQPGGPGRPKGTGQVARCKAWADRYGFKFLERVAEGKEKDVNGFGEVVAVNLKLRVECAQYLVDRGYGRPAQTHDLKTGELPAVFTLKLGAAALGGGE